VLAAAALALAGAAASAEAFTFTPGDVVVYRVGTGAGSLAGVATPVFLNEYEPSGKLVESVALPTAVSGSNKPLLASGSASSEGQLTLSGNEEFLMLTGSTSTGLVREAARARRAACRKVPFSPVRRLPAAGPSGISTPTRTPS
jgi:hypothetical protein